MGDETRNDLRIIDLSVSLDNFAYEPRSPRIVRYDHREWARSVAQSLGLSPSDFPDGMGNAMDFVEASTHSGTHVDAPLHYGPTSEGRPARSIDEVPLEWCFGNGVVLDMHHKQPGDWIRVSDLAQALDGIGHSLRPGDIVLLHTGADRLLQSSDYLNGHPGLDRDSVLWLVDQGVRVIGIDAYGLDRPFASMAADVRSGDRSAMFPAHMAGRDREYLQIEKLCNLDLIPRPTGFTVACFPIKVERATGGWTRAVALVPSE